MHLGLRTLAIQRVKLAPPRLRPAAGTVIRFRNPVAMEGVPKPDVEVAKPSAGF